MIEAAERFVPAADEVWRLQRGSDADCLFFQHMVNRGEPITDRGTRQGIWIASPGGELLASINSLDADKVLATIERGWAAWEALPDERRRLPEGVELAARHRWEASAPAGGLVLERIARDLAPSAAGPPSIDARPPDEPRSPWNRDFAWFTRAEARAWLPADPAPGDVHAVPAESALRLARFHLVDNVRGQTIPFAPSEVSAELAARVVAREGQRVELELTGATRAAAEEWLLGENMWKPRRAIAHGIETRIAGRATYDLDAGAFTAFDLVALGRRWGHTQNNGRWRDPEPGPIGFHFGLAPERPVVAPTFIAVYNADWVDGSGSEVDNF